MNTNEVQTPDMMCYINVPGFTLTLQQGEDVLFSNRSLHITDNCPCSVVHELYTDLRDTSTRTSASKHLCLLRQYIK
jgi:hypothetical protein